VLYEQDQVPLGNSVTQGIEEELGFRELDLRGADSNRQSSLNNIRIVLLSLAGLVHCLAQWEEHGE
jgi:hypothetical protein